MTGDQLRAWMSERQYTAARLGAELGVTERTVFRWRSSPRVPAFLPLALETLARRAMPSEQPRSATSAA